MYRPQFAYKTPAGCRDEEFTYFFNGANTPLLAANIAGRTVDNIPLLLDQDAPFYWRGWKVAYIETTGENGSAGTVDGWVVPDVSLFLRDCYQNNLSDGYIPAWQYGFPQNGAAVGRAFLSSPPVPLDPEIYCPAGGYVTLFVKAAAGANPGIVTISLFGVKRFKECK